MKLTSVSLDENGMRFFSNWYSHQNDSVRTSFIPFSFHTILIQHSRSLLFPLRVVLVFLVSVSISHTLIRLSLAESNEVIFGVVMIPFDKHNGSNDFSHTNLSELTLSSVMFRVFARRDTSTLLRYIVWWNLFSRTLISSTVKGIRGPRTIFFLVSRIVGVMAFGSDFLASWWRMASIVKLVCFLNSWLGELLE
jgi:hypothetical protein